MMAVLRPPAANGAVGRLYGAAISPSGQVALAGTSALANGKHRIFVFDLSSRAFIKAIDAQGGDVKRLEWSPDGTLLAAAYAGSPALRVFDANGRMVFEQPFPGDTYNLSFSPSGSLAVSTDDRKIYFFKTQDGKVSPDGALQTSLTDPHGLHYSPDGKKLAVGYISRASKTSIRIDVFDVASRKLDQAWTFDDLPEGNLMNVAWQRDGKAIYAGGTANRDGRHYIIKRIGWPDGGAREYVAGGNSVLDFVAVPNGRIVFATAEPAWGRIDAEGGTKVEPTPIIKVLDASVLRINSDATVVSWATRLGEGTVNFDLALRKFSSGGGAANTIATPSSSALKVSDWENHLSPKIAGRKLKLNPAEISRASVVLPDGSAMILGTSRALRKFTADGSPAWSVSMPTEVKAVNVSVDGRILVAAIGDGSIQWRRIEDGAILMTLFALKNGKWIISTDQGYFDAAIGAESLIGWLVTRNSGDQADYFDVSRFRARYYRPDVIDRVLAKADVQLAAVEANAIRRALAVRLDPLVLQRLNEMTAPALLKLSLPPAVTILSPAIIESDITRVNIEYKLFSADASPVREVTVRVDGRPYDFITNDIMALGKDESLGKMSLELPSRYSLVQVFAANANGTSRPGEVLFFWRAPPIAAIPDAPNTPALAVAPTLTIPPAAPAVATAAPPPRAKTPIAAPIAGIDPAPAAATIAPAPVLPTIPAATPAAVASAAPAASSTTARQQQVDWRPRLFLLAVGVSDYVDTTFKLNFAAKDATDFAKKFQAQEGKYYKRVETRVLTNKQATAAAIREGLAWLRMAVSRDDIGILYVAGHGVNHVDDTYYFLPHDVNVEQLARTAVSEDLFRDTLTNMMGKSLFFVDTCYSGKSVGVFSNQDLTRIANKLSSAEYGVIVFSASHGKQLSYESELWGNGAFTKALVEGLDGNADFRDEGTVTYRGLDYYVGGAVSRLTEGAQTPVTTVPAGLPDFGLVIVPKKRS
jgi:hypothetical protein